MIVFTAIILRVKLPDFEITFFVRLFMSIVFGFLFYIPLISALMDIFICTEVAKDTIFFDIDCNTEWWGDLHIVYTTAVSLALLIVIPGCMYIRIKFQEIPHDLNILI